MRRLLSGLVAGLALMGLPSAARAEAFDFYVLALSWSPSYCASQGTNANRQQCGASRPYSFVVHGLWPQRERGYPQDCPTGEPRVPRELARTLFDLMPSTGLIGAQWRKHGSCSGLSQTDYFRLLRQAREKVRVPNEFSAPRETRVIAPAQVETRFIQSNPGLKPDAVAVVCDGPYLGEVRICMTKDLAFRACPEVDRRACKRGSAQMPPLGNGR
ncbi:MAG: ribonuclease T2 [Methylobacterium mesophilicum]|nr:ribonuclease T2 [Methylobacterium mesophilicum]